MCLDASGPDAPKKNRIMIKALGEAFTIITLDDVSSTVVSMDGIMIQRLQISKPANELSQRYLGDHSAAVL